MVIGDTSAPTGIAFVANAVQWNRIGTDPFGTSIAGYGNSRDGVSFAAGAAQCWIGPENVI